MTASPMVHVVDDDASMRRSLARLLGGAGHEVAFYATAEEFLAVAGSSLTGCILLDLRLPGSSGLELQDRLVELAELRALAETLSDRQREVWLRVVRGDLNKQIAHDLRIVERTVKLHRAKAMEKLHARSTADLVRVAERLGLAGGEGS